MNAARTAKSGRALPYKGDKRGRKPPPDNETARDRFIRIGNARMVNALHGIKLIGNLSRGAYEWTLDDIDRMERALVEQVRETAEEFRRLKTATKKEKPEFSFSAAAGNRPAFSIST